jgi:hypothetical protein
MEQHEGASRKGDSLPKEKLPLSSLSTSPAHGPAGCRQRCQPNGKNVYGRHCRLKKKRDPLHSGFKSPFGSL